MATLNLNKNSARNFFSFLMMLLLPFAATLLQAEEKEEANEEAKVNPLIIVSKETTFFTKPLLPNGRVDYLTAINKYKKEKIKGLVPEKNGAIYLVKATGPKEGGPIHFNNLLKAMGVNKKGKGILALPTNKDPRLVHFREYLDLQIAMKNKKEIRLDSRQQLMEDFNNTEYNKPWKKADNPHIWAWVQMNEKPLKLVATGTEQPFFYLPYAWSTKDEKPDMLMGVLLPVVQESRTFARLFAKRAMLHLGENRPAEAAKDLMVIHKFARQIGNRGTLIECIVGIAIERIALNGDWQLAQHPQFSSQQLKEYTKKVQSLPAVTDSKEALNLFARSSSLDSVQYLSVSSEDDETGGIFGKDFPFRQYLLILFIDWNLVLEEFNLHYDDIYLINQMSPCQRKVLLKKKGLQLLQEGKESRKVLKSRRLLTSGFLWSLEYRSKIVARIFLPMLSPLYKLMFHAEQRLLIRQELGAIHFQLERYKRKKGKYPASLKELVPNFLPAIPQERFVKDQELKYKSNGKSFKLYSVGVDGKDDKGAGREASLESWDIAIEVP